MPGARPLVHAPGPDPGRRSPPTSERGRSGGPRLAIGFAIRLLQASSLAPECRIRRRRLPFGSLAFIAEPPLELIHSELDDRILRGSNAVFLGHLPHATDGRWPQVVGALGALTVARHPPDGGTSRYGCQSACIRLAQPISGERRVPDLGQLLKRPGVAVGVAEEDERAPIHDLDVAGLDPAAAQLILQCLGVLDHHLQALL